METTTKTNVIRLLTFIALISGAITMSSIHAAEPENATTQQGDPARWFQEDMTPLSYFKTLKKEAEAVYQLSVIDCKRLPRGQVGSCLRAAKDTLRQDIADAYSKSGIKGK